MDHNQSPAVFRYTGQLSLAEGSNSAQMFVRFPLLSEFSTRHAAA